ncbi:Regulator of nonsense transcripts 1 [Thelohanellus kitauei]|uniref:Regulator of nonsense transcripts 1 n=1 Tax=Thelohanellus kitauei TaxID=669202 RepID=A0A0C2ICZ2_THEKT|nr:Regulator of nonsense transcripts 1 [Thelohanellus kitauei]
MSRYFSVGGFSISDENKEYGIPIRFSFLTKTQVIVSYSFLDAILNILDQLTQFYELTLIEQVKWNPWSFALTESSTHLFLLLLLENIKNVVLFRYAVSTNLWFERRIDKLIKYDVFEIFFDEFKALCLYLGYCYEFNYSKVKNATSQQAIETVVGSVAENASNEKDESYWKWTDEDYFEILRKYLSNQDTVDAKVRFDDILDYERTFTGLMKDEAEYQQITSDVQQIYMTPFSCSVISYEKQSIVLKSNENFFNNNLRYGDFVRIRDREDANKTSVGRVVDIEDTSKQIYIDISLGCDIPTDKSSCDLELIWRCVTFTRMMVSLHNFVRKDSGVNGYLKNIIPGLPVEPENLNITFQGDFHVPGLPKLNESQLEIVKKSLENGLSLIQGPPGTGKTVIITAIVFYIVKYLKKRVLVCASSNKAIDNVYQKIKATGVKVIRVEAKHRKRDENPNRETNSFTSSEVRTLSTESSTISIEKVNPEKSDHGFGMGVPKNLGSCQLDSNKPKRDSGNSTKLDHFDELSNQNVNITSLAVPDQQPQNSPTINEFKGCFSDELSSYKIGVRRDASVIMSDVVCATCSGAGDPRVFGLTFDYVLIDESTQSTETECLIPISLCHGQLIMVGDHRQLAPVVLNKSAIERGLSLSMFERLIRTGVVPFRLNVQFRMHPALSEFSSLAFYEGTIQNGVTAGMAL